MPGPANSQPRGPLVPKQELIKPASSGIGQLLTWIFISWVVLFLLSLGLSTLIWPFAAFTLFGLVSIPLLGSGINVLVAKREVLGGKKEVDLFFGLAKLVSWDPTEGILFMENKAVTAGDDRIHDDGGGIVVIYPVRGEEVAFRAPLEIQTVSFHDENVLTREYLPMMVHGTMKWRIDDLRQFFLLVSQQIHVVTDREGHRILDRGASQPVPLAAPGDPTAIGYQGLHTTANRKLEAAEEWLRFVAEETTRSVVSRISTGLLVAERVASDLPPQMKEDMQGHVINPMPLIPSSTANYRNAADGLAAAIQSTLGPRVQEFGIHVFEITLQEARLPEHFHHTLVEVAKQSYVPFVAQKQAAARKMELQAVADVIGSETVGAREVVAAAPAFALSDFLTNYLANNRALFAATQRQSGHVPE